MSVTQPKATAVAGMVVVRTLKAVAWEVTVAAVDAGAVDVAVVDAAVVDAAVATDDGF